MSLGFDPMGSSCDPPASGGHVPFQHENPAPAPVPAPAPTHPSCAALALPQFVHVTETSVVNETAIMGTLQASLNTLLDHLRAAGPSDKFHEDLGAMALEQIDAAFNAFMPAGSDAACVVAAVKSWTEPHIAAADMQPESDRALRSNEERSRLLDQKTLLATVQRLAAIRDVLAESNPRMQRESIIQHFGGRRDNASQERSEVLLRSALLHVTADLATRTLDFSRVIKACDDASLRGEAVNLLANFGSESHPGPHMDFAALPYAEPDRVRLTRADCMRGLWSACRFSIAQADDRLFASSFSALVVYGRQAATYFHECLRLATIDMPRGDGAPRPRSAGPLPTERMTKIALGMLGRLGPDPFASFLVFIPTPPESITPGGDVVQDALLLSQHLGSPVIQEYALMFLKSCAFRRIPKAAVTGNSSMIADDHAGYLREYDSRVSKKFERLTLQMHDMFPRQRACVLSMIPIGQVLKFAANNEGTVSAEVQSDALSDLLQKLTVLAPRVASAANPSELRTLFAHVRDALKDVSTQSLDVIGKHRSVMNLINETIGSP